MKFQWRKVHFVNFYVINKVGHGLARYAFNGKTSKCFDSLSD